VKVSFELLAEQNHGVLEAEIVTKFGSHIRAQTRSRDLSLQPAKWTRVELEGQAQQGELLHRIVFRTGEYRNIGGASPVSTETDRPQSPVVFRIRHLLVKAGT
jgi:hypothetical protein